MASSNYVLSIQEQRALVSLSHNPSDGRCLHWPPTAGCPLPSVSKAPWKPW